MGLDITTNDRGEYKLNSTISDESYHPHQKWVSEEEAKKLLIEEAFLRFIEKAIEIDLTFPTNYRINDICGKRTAVYYEWVSAAYKSADVNQTFADKFNEIHTRLKLEIKI
jgi:hypothetical protein